MNDKEIEKRRKRYGRWLKQSEKEQYIKDYELSSDFTEKIDKYINTGERRQLRKAYHTAKEKRGFARKQLRYHLDEVAKCKKMLESAIMEEYIADKMSLPEDIDPFSIDK